MGDFFSKSDCWIVSSSACCFFVVSALCLFALSLTSELDRFYQSTTADFVQLLMLLDSLIVQC
jgi:hypothetical protein